VQYFSGLSGEFLFYLIGAANIACWSHSDPIVDCGGVDGD
jgi:hypothetical protein